MGNVLNSPSLTICGYTKIANGSVKIPDVEQSLIRFCVVGLFNLPDFDCFGSNYLPDYML